MRTLRWLAATVLLCGTVLISSAGPAHAANVLSNPGFESGSLSPWSCSGGLGSVVSSPVHTGTKALAGAASDSDNATCTQTVSVQPGTAYTLSGWVRGNYVYLGVTGGSSIWTPSATSYTQLSVSFTTGASQSSVQVFIHGWYAQGTYYADDLALDGPGGTGPPAAPTGATVTATTSGSISLSWAASTGATGYRVYEGTTVRADVTSTSATVSGLAACSSHTYTVRAYNTAGESGSSNAVTATTSGCSNAPATPTGLSVTGVTSSSISLSWNASTGATGYRLYEGSSQVFQGSATSATISGLASCSAHSYTVSAYNANGESAHSAAVGATTSGCPSMPGLPTAPYVDMGAWPTPSLTDMAVAGNLKSFTLAFITASGCKAMWFNAYDPRQAWARDQIDAIRARGGDVKISFGGASGIELAQACSTVAALQAEYQAVVTAYALKFIDLDIEGAATADPVSVDRRSQALAALQRANPGLKVSLTLPVLPEGLTADGINVVRSARDAGVDLDIVNVMAMDYYRSGDYGDLAVQAANSTFAQLKSLYPAKSDAQVWKMVGVTPMLGQNDDGHIYDQNDARQLVTFAQGKHLGVLAFWETTRDRNACTGALYMCTNIAQTPYEFSKIFAGYTG
jgi:hypothetical protein